MKVPGTIQSMIDGLIAEGLPGGGWRQEENALYLANLPHDTTAEDLYTIFASFGAIPPRGVKVMPGSPGQRTFGFCNFMEAANAEFAMMAMNGVTQPDGCKLIVKLKQQKGKGEGKGKGGDFKGYDGGDMASNGMSTVPPGVDPLIWSRLQNKLKEDGVMSSYDISQWYIIEHLSHVADEEEMKVTCDMLLSACEKLGLP